MNCKTPVNREINNIKFINEKLNDHQKKTIQFAISAKELCLIHGPPGTGKTSVLAEIIMQLAFSGKKVLVVSPSNIAIDTIAERVLYTYKDRSEILFSRIGHPVRMLDEIKKISIDEQIERSDQIRSKIDELKKQLIKKYIDHKTKTSINEKINSLEKERRRLAYELIEKSNVIFATCVGSGDRDLKGYFNENEDQYFDVVILDEATQSKEYESVIPILLGKK